MGFLINSKELPKQRSQKFIPNVSVGTKAIAHELVHAENMMEDYIDVYDIAWQVRYEKRVTQELQRKYRRMQSSNPELETYVPEQILNQLHKLFQ